MADIVDRATRSRMMAGIRSRNTRPELALRRAIHARGLRYRLHDRRLPGTPDLVFRRFGAVCLVHGCFWHRSRRLLVRDHTDHAPRVLASQVRCEHRTGPTQPT